jgi:sulfite dehydrogenase (quinone) subunit SoeC
MHPSLSVIFFTVLSGAGYGLWFFLGLSTLRSSSLTTMQFYTLAVSGFIFVTIGLISSTSHLGQPQRAWRAFSQWRTSWLSREGVSAVLCFLPFVLLCVMRYAGSEVFVYKLTGIALAALSVITVICTSMIYHCLKTVPAWRHPFVPLIYLLFAGVVGRLLFLSLTSNSDSRIASTTSISIIVSLLLLYAAKKIVWKDIEHLSLESLRASALGLPAGSAVRVFEHPHTEANFISKEMLFVLARKHAAKLRSCRLCAWRFCY